MYVFSSLLCPREHLIRAGSWSPINCFTRNFFGVAGETPKPFPLTRPSQKTPLKMFLVFRANEKMSETTPPIMNLFSLLCGVRNIWIIQPICCHLETSDEVWPIFKLGAAAHLICSTFLRCAWLHSSQLEAQCKAVFREGIDRKPNVHVKSKSFRIRWELRSWLWHLMHRWSWRVALPPRASRFSSGNWDNSTSLLDCHENYNKEKPVVSNGPGTIRVSHSLSYLTLHEWSVWNAWSMCQ